MRNLHIQFVYINFAAVFGFLCSYLLIEILIIEHQNVI